MKKSQIQQELSLENYNHYLFRILFVLSESPHDFEEVRLECISWLLQARTKFLEYSENDDFLPVFAKLEEVCPSGYEHSLLHISAAIANDTKPLLSDISQVLGLWDGVKHIFEGEGFDKKAIYWAESA